MTTQALPYQPRLARQTACPLTKPISTTCAEHRLYFPFSLLQLLVDMNGKDLPRMRYARPPTLQEIVDHLNALTNDSLPLALAHTIHNADDWQGLGLLSGSRLSDLILALAVFSTRYEEGRWLALLQAAISGCTEQDAQWLTSLPAPADSPLPAPQSQTKRKASVMGGSDIRNQKRPAATPRAPVRRSPRSHRTHCPSGSNALASRKANVRTKRR